MMGPMAPRGAAWIHGSNAGPMGVHWALWDSMGPCCAEGIREVQFTVVPLLCAAVGMPAIYMLGAPVSEHKISGAAHNDTQPLALQWAFGLQWMAPPEPIGPPPEHL